MTECFALDAATHYHTNMIHTIAFKPCSHGDFDYGVLPCIDGQPITDLIHEYEKNRNENAPKLKGFLGVQSSPKKYSQDTAFPYNLMYGYDPATVANLPVFNRDEAIVLACGCGEWGCSRTTVRIKVTNSQVHWHNLRTSFEKRTAYPNFGPWTFDREQYQSACLSIRSHHRKIVCEEKTKLFRKLEIQHLIPRTRSNRDMLENLLHYTFTEIDVSGQTYTRDQVLELLPNNQESDPSIQNFRAIPLDPIDPTTELIQTTYMLTYTDRDNYSIHSQRSSI